MIQKKIALCFLTYDDISKANLWKNMINEANKLDKKYNIYIHNKNKLKFEYFKKYSIQNKINTKWADISLVKATILLFEEAYKDENNMFFILLSDKCIPLYSLNQIYDKIIKINNNIISKSSNNILQRYNKVNDKNFIIKNEFSKQSKWMILNRETVSFFINNNFINYFGNNFKYLDEHYFITIILKLIYHYKNSFTNICKLGREK